MAAPGVDVAADAQARFGMLSKSTGRARTGVAAGLALFLLTSCTSMLPWSRSPEATANEINLSFVVQNNLLFLPSTTIDDHAGRYLFGSATPRSIIDRAFAAGTLGGGRASYRLGFGERSTVPIQPLLLDLAGAGDGVIGADVFAAHAVTVDYRSGLLTYQLDGIYPAYMTIFPFTGEPAVTALVDGRSVAAVVDTASPDTLTLAGGQGGRGRAHVVIAGTDFGSVDVKFANVGRARIGNRLLSKFLVSIDYKRHIVGLWRDPRIAL
jgi:hypothetical protein